MSYVDESIKTLDGLAHIRRRPGMYIGRTGDGSHHDDGIYIMFKECIDNSIDEFRMGNGSKILATVADNEITIQDYGRGIPLNKLEDAVSKVNTSGKFDSESYQRVVGLHGLGIKIVNALSTTMKVISYRDGDMREIVFKDSVLHTDTGVIKNTTNIENGTFFSFSPSNEFFKDYKFNLQYIEARILNYCYLNTGLQIYLNGVCHESKNGLRDLLAKNVDDSIRYDIIHLKDKDVEIAFTHDSHYGESYHTFVNGQYTNDGGTHQQAVREAFVKTIRDFYGKSFDVQDIRASIVLVMSIGIVDPIFESQTKNKLGSTDMIPGGIKIKKFMEDFLSLHLNDYLHKNKNTADAILARIMQSERERKEISGIRKLANERSKKANLCNKKLRDCRKHFNDKVPNYESSLFIVEGDSAAGSITKTRDVEYQAVFGLKGKPLNVLGLTKKICYENEELNLLQNALGLDDGIDGLRYNKIVISVDADYDGGHIAMLIITFFSQFYPDVIEKGHLHLLATPLFRVRNGTKSVYCKNEAEKQKAMSKLKNSEVTRFKGLGEISPDEFKHFIHKDTIETIPVSWDPYAMKVVDFFMGKNTTERVDFIMDNLRDDQ